MQQLTLLVHFPFAFPFAHSEDSGIVIEQFAEKGLFGIGQHGHDDVSCETAFPRTA
jgi:hypothetical protein